MHSVFLNINNTVQFQINRNVFMQARAYIRSLVNKSVQHK